MGVVKTERGQIVPWAVETINLCPRPLRNHTWETARIWDLRHFRACHGHALANMHNGKCKLKSNFEQVYNLSN